MDGLARVAPVARPLLSDVDSALLTLGAPASHPVWDLLRATGVTPGDAVSFFADLAPQALRATAAQLRARAEDYLQTTLPTSVGWEGAAAEHSAATLAALRRHLVGDGVTGDDPASLAGRLRATASSVERMADWQQRWRDEMAAMLARVITSRQAVLVRSHPGLGAGLAEATRSADGVATAVRAAADIGAALLAVADDALAAGRDLLAGAGAELVELDYRAPEVSGPAPYGGPIRVH
jgi:hypothetical protein